MKNMYTLLQICEVWGTFDKDGSSIPYKYTKGWFAVESLNDSGESVLRFTKEYKLCEGFSAKIGAKSENLLFNEKGRLYALA